MYRLAAPGVFGTVKLRDSRVYEKKKKDSVLSSTMLNETRDLSDETGD